MRLEEKEDCERKMDEDVTRRLEKNASEEE